MFALRLIDVYICMVNVTNLEAQITILEKRLVMTPEKINGKYNPQHFALKGAIKNKKKLLEQRRNFDWLAQ